MVGCKPTIPEQLALLQLYYRFNADYKLIFEAFAEEFPGMQLPKRAAVWDAKWRFEAKRTVAGKKRSGCPSIIDEEMVHSVTQTFIENSNQLAVKVVQQLDMWRTTVQQALKKLCYKVYQPYLLHALNEDDLNHCLQFCKWLNVCAEADPTFLENIMWTDKATFHLNGIVNQHNCVYYASKYPHPIMTKELQSPGISVRARFISYLILWPYYSSFTTLNNTQHSKHHIPCPQHGNNW